MDNVIALVTGANKGIGKRSRIPVNNAGISGQDRTPHLPDPGGSGGLAWFGAGQEDGPADFGAVLALVVAV